MNNPIIDNPIIDSFLQSEDIRALYMAYLSNPDELMRKRIEEHFEEHYRKILILSYAAKTLHFEAQRFDKKIRGHKEKYPLLLNQENGLEDSIYSQTNEVDEILYLYEYQIENAEQLLEIISDKRLYMIIDGLKLKNKELLYFLFIKGLDEKEIAQKLGISVQAVNKRKNSLLKKIKKLYEE